jgi:hypothetical protein
MMVMRIRKRLCASDLRGDVAPKTLDPDIRDSLDPDIPDLPPSALVHYPDRVSVR